MMMEMEDLLNRMRDINSMKVTREIQQACLHNLPICIHVSLTPCPENNGTALNQL